MRAELKCVTATDMGLSVMTIGITMMLMLCVNNLDSLQLVSTINVIILSSKPVCKYKYTF